MRRRRGEGEGNWEEEEQSSEYSMETRNSCPTPDCRTWGKNKKGDITLQTTFIGGEQKEKELKILYKYFKN